MLQLLTSNPTFLEAYESVDAAGATVRRTAFIDPDARLLVSAAQTPSNSAATPSVPAGISTQQACQLLQRLISYSWSVATAVASA